MPDTLPSSVDGVPLTVAGLKATGARPHWFGLGFIQLKIDDDRRLHFWHPDLMADTPEEELHDHRYEFTSRIVRGAMTHETWEFVEDQYGDHEMVEVSCEPGKEADPNPVARGHVRLAGRYTMVEGSVYTFPPTGFHRIEASRAVTLLTRGPKVRDVARVIKELGAPTVCPFSKDIPEDELWGYIADLLGDTHRPGYHLRPIEKGVLGEASKIREETEEFVEAIEQGVAVMAIAELADLYGAVEAYLAKHHPSLSMADLAAMNEATRRAFANGRR